MSRKFFLTSLNFYRLFLVAALVAQKFHQDDSFSNKSFADLVGITVKELNILEAKFLFAISFSLYVLPKTYKEYNRIVGGQRINRQLVEARRSNLSFFSLFPHTVNLSSQEEKFLSLFTSPSILILLFTKSLFNTEFSDK